MNERNPYAPPLAPVADVPADAPAAAVAPPFFAVSLLKYMVMSVTTLGLYELYWFYRNWRLIKDREAPYIQPFWRAVFAVFFCYQCFARIREYEHPAIGATRLAAGPLAACWIVLTLLWRLPDPYWWVSTLSFLAIVPVQRRVNQINNVVAPDHDRNDRFTWVNWVWVGLFGLLLLLAIIGALLPDD